MTRPPFPGLIRALLILLVLWYGLSAALGETLIPRPHRVLAVLAQLLLKGSLLRHGLASLWRLSAGIGAALCAALPLGIAAGVSPRTDRVLSPLAYLLYPLPKIAFLPVFMLLFGLGDLSRIVLLWTVLVLQLFLAARDGVRSIPEEFRIAAKTLELDRKERFFKLYLPSALPRLFSALRISVGIGMAVLFFAENYAAAYGLGYFIMNSWVMINYPMMYAGILALGFLAWLLLLGVDALERRLCPWSRREA